MIDFRKEFFEDIFKIELGYHPSIKIAPAHLANGFFRELAGGYYNNEAQHLAIALKLEPVPELDNSTPDKKTQNERRKFSQFSDKQQQALHFMAANRLQRRFIGEAFNADRTVFTNVGQSSYSLSHCQHTTYDNHDRFVGQWLTAILQAGSERPAYDLLYTLLTQQAQRGEGGMPMTDALSLMTLPLMIDSVPPKIAQQIPQPKSVKQSVPGTFDDPIVQTIRAAFDQLAENDATSARKNGKLDTLRRMVTLGCFCFYLHLVNIGRLGPHYLPMLLYLDQDARTVKFASQATYGRVRHSIDAFLHAQISARTAAIIGKKLATHMDPDETVKRFIFEEVNWYRYAYGNEKERSKVDGFQADCWNFYQSYRGDAAANEPIDALARALTDMVNLVFSATAFDVAYNLGVKIGLLTRGDRRDSKPYELHADLLEVLVRSTIPRGETWSIDKLARHWWERFGILFGGLGNENQLLSKWGVEAIDTNELAHNRGAFAHLLEQIGYAQSYADGIVLVRVEI